ncbi:hypothetical protein F5884DRAFT_658496, partial [Xylogone sp. PMI_703]
GGDQLHKTTTAKLESNAEVVWRYLPRTIQDAMIVATQIGLGYLWADSLGIIQDDGNDKMREIAQMPNIYNNATATIVAAKAGTASDGFLQEFQPRTSLAPAEGLEYLANTLFKLPFRCPDGRVGSVYLSEVGMFEESEPIYTRAWTLQESYLSRRLLRYSNFQCSMICQGSPLRPHTVDGWKLDQSYDTQQLNNILFRDRRGFGDAGDEVITRDGSVVEVEIFNQEPEQADDLWRDLVVEYTSRNLGVAADRCLAISGLADRAAPIIQSRYLAGHWEVNLPLDLLWWADYRTAQITPTAYQGPSWSWTSINGQVRYAVHDTDGVHVSLDIQHVNIVPCHDAAPFGALKYGIICGRGKILRTQWTGDTLELMAEEGGSTLFSRRTADSFYRPDTVNLNITQSDMAKIRAPVPMSTHIDFLGRHSLPLTGDASLPIGLSLLEVCNTARSATGLNNDSGLLGLILIKLPDTFKSSRPRYMRVGMFDFTDKHTYDYVEDTTLVEEFKSHQANQDTCFDKCNIQEFELL